MIGLGETVCDVVGLEIHPVDPSVKTNWAVPEVKPVTMPTLFTLAIEGFKEDQVPPVEGCKLTVPPIQSVVALVLTVGFENTVTFPVGNDIHPVVVLVNVKFAKPAVTAVTTPPFVTVATLVFDEDQVPPVVGDKVVLEPIQIPFGPVIFTDGLALTVMVVVGKELQPVEVLVNTKEVFPALIPVTIPALVTEAIEGLLLVQVPPLEGDKEVVAPIQIIVGPVIETTGLDRIVISADESEIHPVDVLVNTNLAVPGLIAFTSPAEEIVATEG